MTEPHDASPGEPAGGPGTERLAAELVAAREELQRSRERLGDFADQVGHDLRNPLTSVSMSLQMLREQPSVMEDDEALWMVERALSGAERMNVLIEEQLQYARLSGELTRTSVDPAAVAREVADELTGRQATPVTVEVGELPEVYADRDQLSAVLRHLFVDVARHADGPLTILVTGERTETGSRIEVTSIGSAPTREERGAAFEAAPGGDAPGEGLVLCRRIVKAHGGRIGMSQTPARGALVWFELP